MAINFHEGLSGAGKSYEAVVQHIIPKLKEGRKVFTNIRGMNHEKIAEILEKPVEEIQALLFQIEWNDIPLLPHNVLTIPDKYRDSFIVIDELQDYYPASRMQLDAETTEFITQHRQFGLDILCLGQSLKDCHAIWRRRIQTKIFFLNKEAIGQPNKYKWEAWQQIQPDKWQKVNSGGGEYEEKYFGSYLSHRENVANTTQYNDKRANVLNNWKFKFAMPAVAIGFVWAIYFMYSLFTEPMVKIDKAENKPSPNQTSNTSPGNQTVDNSPGQTPQAQPLQIDFKTLQHKIVYFGSYTKDKKQHHIFSVLDENNNVTARFNQDEISYYGYTLDLNNPTHFLITDQTTKQKIIVPKQGAPLLSKKS